MENNKPKVSICCITYNQKNYIKQALDSFLMQKTNFPFVVIIGDDASNDGTTEIVKEYALKYPDIIKPVFQERNSGGFKNFCDVFNLIDTEYVALCEGDDYWTDENKLQKQVDCLDAHKNCTICFHKTKNIFENNLQEPYDFPNEKQRFNKTLLTLNDIIRFNFIQTNSCMYRCRFKGEDIGKYLSADIMPGDWYLHILHAEKGNIIFLDETMSVYRINPNGVWYNAYVNPETLHLKYGVKELNFIDKVYNNFLNESKEYLSNNKKFIVDIIDIYCKNFCVDELQEIKTKFPEFVDLYVDVKKSNLDITKSKYTKYKKLFNNTLVIAIISVVLVIALSIWVIWGN